MNFFQQLAQLGVTGTIKMTVQPGNPMTVSIMVDQPCGDQAAKLIPPLLVSGTPEELDEGFFTAIDQPLRKSSGLVSNMESYLKQVEEAQKQSKLEKDKAEKEKKEKEAKKKAFDEAMKKVTELEKEGKLREAIAKLPKKEQHPDFAESIEKVRTSLLNKINGDAPLLSMFSSTNEPETETETEPDSDENDEDNDYENDENE